LRSLLTSNLAQAFAALRPRRAGVLLRRILPDQRGNAAIVIAAGLPLLIGAAGLAVDGVQWVLQKRTVQAAADSAALAGVYGIINSQDMESAVNDTLNRTASLPPNANIQAIHSPEGHETDPFAVTVRLTVPARTVFASMFLRRPLGITAEATATVVENGEYCAMAVGSIDDSGVVVRPNSSVEMECGVATNSGAAKAVDADGSSSLKSPSVLAYGGVDSGGPIKDSRVRSHGLKQEDPLAESAPPLVPNTGCPNVTINADAPGETMLQPGCYANMFLNATVRLQDGEYILNRGNFVVGPHGHVECDACTIFLTSETAATDGSSIGKVKISSEATVKMNATREGPNAGILFYQDRNAARDLPGDENRVGGSSFSHLNGLLYFPSDTLYLDANMGPDLQCTRMLAKRIVFAGRVYISKKCDGLGRMTFSASEVRLVS
jgi:Flp pilus assembly protein TadG